MTEPFYAGTTGLAMINCILWANTAGSHSPQFSCDAGAGGQANVTMTNCAIQDGEIVIWEAGTSLNVLMADIDTDPRLTPDGHLRSDSPCIDAGTDPGAYASSTDRDAEAAPAGTAFDIGADEFIDTDADKLPDWWEQAYFGSTTGANPADDTDGDGLTNIEEYENFSSNPIATPIYVDAANANDPDEDGSVAHPFDRILTGILNADNYDTVLVAPGTYPGNGNSFLDFQHKSLVVRKQGSTGEAIIDCQDLDPLIYDESIKGTFAAMDGFTVRNSRYNGGMAGRSEGGEISTDVSQFIVRNCLFTNDYPLAPNYGVTDYLSSGTYDGVSIGAPPDDPQDKAGFIVFSSTHLAGDLTVRRGTLSIADSYLYGDGGIHLESDARLFITDDEQLNVAPPATSDSPVTMTADITGTGDIEIDAGEMLIVGEDAVIDLSRDQDDACGKADNIGGEIIVNGSLIVTDDATVRNSTICVNQIEFEGNNVIQNNNISLLEATAGFGGQFFIQGSASILDNRITSEGDRYLDLDPEENNPTPPTIQNNIIDVLIKPGTPVKQGRLLELRSQDVDCDPATDPAGCPAGAFPLASSAGYDDTWALDTLEVQPNAKLNLTNRQGFDFNGEDSTDTIYVKKLVLHANAVLNVAGQRVYYQSLVDENDAVIDPSQPHPNGSQIVDVPLLGFSLGIIAMNDDTEFGVRVRTRLTDPQDYDDENPDALLPQGAIERLADIRGTGDGVMEMNTQPAGETKAAGSIAAKGQFARAAEDKIVVALEYRFLDRNGDLHVAISGDRNVGENNVSIAVIYPPAAGLPGSPESSEYATFYGTFPRGSVNFARASFIELELRSLTDGDGNPLAAKVRIDNWDPQITCSYTCADFDEGEDVTEADYLLLLAEVGQTMPSSKSCLDLNGNHYVGLGDILVWDSFSTYRLNACGDDYATPMSMPLVNQRMSSPLSCSTTALTMAARKKEPNTYGIRDDAPVSYTHLTLPTN